MGNLETSLSTEIDHNTAIDQEAEKMEQLYQMKNSVMESVCRNIKYK